MNNINFNQTEDPAAIITKIQEDSMSTEQLFQALEGVENSNSPIFAFFSNDNLVY
jgi:hypothetical protein